MLRSRFRGLLTLRENGLFGEAMGVALTEPLRVCVAPTADMLLAMAKKAVLILGTPCLLLHVDDDPGTPRLTWLSLRSPEDRREPESLLSFSARARLAMLVLGFLTSSRMLPRMLGRRAWPRLMDSFLKMLPLVIPSISLSEMLGKLRRRVPQVAARDTMDALSAHIS